MGPNTHIYPSFYAPHYVLTTMYPRNSTAGLLPGFWRTSVTVIMSLGCFSDAGPGFSVVSRLHTVSSTINHQYNLQVNTSDGQII